jgi:hypothetical protein
MHIIDPAASSIALALLCVAGLAILFAIGSMLLSTFVDFSYQVEEVLDNLFVPALITFVVALMGMLGFILGAQIDTEHQLQHEARQRYGIQLTDDQISDLYDVRSRDERTGVINGRETTLMGSTITNGGKVITLAQVGDTYLLLASKQYSELPLAE